MAWPTNNMNWNGDYNNCDDYHAIHLNQPQALRSPQVSLDFYSGSSECARPPSPSTRNTALDSQAMPPTSESLNWSMLSSTNYGNVFSTGFSSPTPEIGPNYSPETTEGLFSHTASTSPGGQVMSLPGQTRQTLEQKDCNNEVYNQALKTGKHARTQAIGKRTKRSQQSRDPPLAQPIKCKWDGCNYPGTFKHESLLIRHLKNIHLSPGAHPCCVQGCDRVCNRADNLTQHMRNVHR